MKKIGIVTLYGEDNFGNKLQNYATQEYFKSLGYECTTLRYLYYNPVLYPFVKVKNTIKKIIKQHGRKSELQKRENVFSNFSKQYIRKRKLVNFKNIPYSLSSKFNFFVTGSDQVWHNYSKTAEEINYFMLSFARPEQRITMSPSFGLREIPNEFREVYAAGLNGFKYLSVREIEAANIVKNLTSKEAEVILDPTMLVDEKVWYDIVKKPKIYETSPYILLYNLGALTDECRRFIDNCSKNNNLKVIDINSKQQGYYQNTRPDEFLWWIKNAKLIITDSFHATVFSILFNRPFVVSERVGGEKMGDRIDTLLEKFDLKKRKQLFDVENALIFEVDYNNVKKILCEERKKALVFYKRML